MSSAYRAHGLRCRAVQLRVAQPLSGVQNAEGAILGPFDCWLALRGLTTMALRMERQASSAALLAQHLACHPLIQRVSLLLGLNHVAGQCTLPSESSAHSSQMNGWALRPAPVITDIRWEVCICVALQWLKQAAHVVVGMIGHSQPYCLHRYNNRL